MGKRYSREDIKKAAKTVQQAWLSGLEQTLSPEESALPSGMQERITQAVTEQTAAAEKIQAVKETCFRRPVRRAAIAVLAVCLLAAVWLGVDKSARAEVQDWFRTLRGNAETYEWPAKEAYSRLIDFIGGEGETRSLYKKAKGEAYRPYYGGAYLNEEKVLVVNVTDDSPEICTVFANVLQYDRVIFQKVQYSYDELYALYENLNRTEQGTEPFAGLAGCGIDVRNNRIEVSFTEDDETLRQAFLDRLKDNEKEMVRFTEGALYTIATWEDQGRAELKYVLQNGLMEGSRLTELGDVESVRTRLPEPDPAEIEAYMQRRVELFPRIIRSEKQTVEPGDLLKISWRVYDETQEYPQFGNGKAETVRCGISNFDEQIELSVEGRTVGETYTISYTNDLVAGPLFCDITPLYIYTVEPAELNDTFVKENTEYQTVEEWRSALLEEERRAGQPEAWDAVLKKLLPECRFKMNEKRLKQSETPERMEALVKEYLLVKALADRYGIEVTAADLTAYCTRHGIRPETQTVTDSVVSEWRTLRELVMDKMTLGD